MVTKIQPYFATTVILTHCSIIRSSIYGAVTYKRIKVTDAKQTEKLQKSVYPVMEVNSVAVNADAELVRSTYIPNK